VPQVLVSDSPVRNDLTTNGAGVDATEFLPALLDADRSIPDFMACASAIRHTGPAGLPTEARSAQAGAPGADGNGNGSRLHPGPQASAAPAEPRTAQVIERLQAAGKDSGRIREAVLAREFGIDPAHLGRLMRRSTGLGFREWSLGIRMRLAVRALAETDVPVKCVAHESGFTSTAQFDRGFRRLFGMTPGDFRRSVCGRSKRT
jgi:AraC-like DNA-binding protein